MKQIKLTGVGADVEVFVADKATGEIVSAENHIKGTKQDPFVFDPENPHFATSLDNVLAEFGIPPATNSEEFYAFLQKSLNFIDATLPQELCTAIQPAAYLDERWLKTRQARRFGCEPDFNAYTLTCNERPFAENKTLRSAGGHVHLGYEDAAVFNPFTYAPDEERANLVRLLDLYLGVPSVLVEPDNERKNLYGKAGAFRPKKYGLEYRTISNFYLKTKELTCWVYDQVIAAVKALNEGFLITDGLAANIQATINTNDAVTANYLIKDFNLNLPII